MYVFPRRSGGEVNTDGHGLIFSLKKRMARTPTDFAVELLIFAQIILAVCNTI